VERVLKAAELAPSAGDLKARKVFFIKAASKRKELSEAAFGQEFVAQAPFVLIFCADLEAIASYGDRGKDLYCVQDATIAATYSMLKASELGLGTCWVGAFDEAKVKDACGLKEGLRPIAMLTLGYEA
jgi:nitroreductase